MKNLLTAVTRDVTPRLFNALLSATAVGGAFCVVFLFVLCFVCVHILKCAELGWKIRRKPPEQNAAPDPKPEEKEKAPAQPQEPIYYIVERKRTRSKAKYGEPKEIRFK